MTVKGSVTQTRSPLQLNADQYLDVIPSADPDMKCDHFASVCSVTVWSGSLISKLYFTLDAHELMCLSVIDYAH